MAIKRLWKLVFTAYNEWNEDQAPRYAAALAFYTTFSIAPLLFLAIGIAGLVFGPQAAEGTLVDQLKSTVGPQAATLIQNAINHQSKTHQTIWMTIVGVAVLLLGASTVFTELQSDLDKMWDVKVKPNKGIYSFIRTRLLSFGLVLIVGFLLLVTLIISAVLSWLDTYFLTLTDNADTLIHAGNFIVSLGIATLLFAAIFKFLPDVNIRWRDVWIGALVTALLFSLGKFALGFYLGRTAQSSTFGAAGALVIVLLWVYYAAQILFFGAELTQVQVKMSGRFIPPAQHAEKTA
jgi:membrane protein